MAVGVMAVGVPGFALGDGSGIGPDFSRGVFEALDLRVIGLI